METFYTLLGLLAVLLPLVILMVIYGLREKRTLTLSVPLKSRKAFEAFKPESYLHRLSPEEFTKVAAMLEESSKKDRLRIAWSYTTPAGRNSYHNKAYYELSSVKEIVDLLAPQFSSGEEKVNGLNRLYENQLSRGLELDEDYPKIYCYSIPDLADKNGAVKVGYAKTNAHKRVEAQFKTAAHLKINYFIHFVMPAITISGDEFTDHKVHRLLKNAGIPNPEGEWFLCSPAVAKAAVAAVQRNRKAL